MPSLRELYDPLFVNRIAEEELFGLAARVVKDVFPSGKPKIQQQVRVSGLSDRDTWARRIVFNTLFVLGYTRPDTIATVTTHGVEAPICQQLFAQYYRAFFVFVAYPTTTPNAANHIQAALIILADTVYIEQVQSKSNGASGGRGLIRALTAHLIPWARAHGLRYIRTSANSPRSAELFVQNGFFEVQPDFADDSKGFRRFLVRDLSAD